MQAKDIEDVYELSPLQHGMLFENLYAPEEGTYVEQSVLTVDGDLDHDAFWRAWQRVVDRHPALRTTFHWNDIKQPVQAVHRTIRLPRDEVDWRGLPAAGRDAALEEALREQRLHGFDIEARPPMAVRLCRVADRRTLIVLCLHHLILDGWSVGLVLSEFMTAYKAFHHGGEPRLPAPGRYRDYVAWWRQGRGAGTERFWREHLAGHVPPPPLDLGTAPPLPEGTLPYQWVDGDLAGPAPRVRAFAREHGITPPTLVQGAWTAVLARCTGAEDVAVGSTFAHRPGGLPNAESIVGCMVASLPIRARVCPDRALLDYLRDIQRSVMYARDDAVASLVEIHDWSGVARSARLFESIVTYQNIPLPRLTFTDEGIELDGYSVDTRPQVPLVLMVMPGDDLPLRLVHDRRRFTAAHAERLLGRVTRALESMLDDPHMTLAGLDVVPDDELRLIERAGRDPRVLERLAAADAGLVRLLRAAPGPVRVRVLDDRLRDVPLGAPGDIHVEGLSPAALADRAAPAGTDGAASADGAGAGRYRPGLRGRLGEGGVVRIDPPVAEGTVTTATGAAGAGGPASTAGEPEGVPGTETERALAGLMADILGVDRVGVRDNLVEFGLHSLLGTRAVNRIRDTWHVSVPLRVIFERPTIAELARVVEAGGAPDERPRATRRVDLAAEATLDPSITASGATSWTASPDRILLTGATGHLGTFLLARLLATTRATVTCLVRDADRGAGLRRLHDGLRAAGLWADSFAGRIEALPGNLARPGLGLDPAAFAALAAETDEIYHAGAVVNILPAYRRVRPVNVDGTREVLRLAATGRATPVHHVSPAELTAHPDPARAGRETALDPDHPDAHNGYIASKWVADRLMTVAAERGLPVVVHRATRLLGTPEYWRPGEATGEIVRACVHLGLVPDAEIALPASPVDHVAAAIASLGRREAALGGHYHHVSPVPFSFRVLGDAMAGEGYEVRPVDIDKWYAELVRLSARIEGRGWDMALAVVGPWKQAAHEGRREPDYDTSRARAALPDLTCPPIDAAYLAAAVRHFQRAGLVPPPAARRDG